METLPYYEKELLLVNKKKYLDDFIFPIEKRLKYRTRNGKHEVLVKWLGYDSTEWVPLKSITKNFITKNKKYK